MDNIRQELSRLNLNWWQRGTEKSLEEAKKFDEEHPKLKNKARKDWQDMSMCYALFCLRIISFIECCPEKDRKKLAQIIKEEIKEEELLVILRIAWKKNRKIKTKEMRKMWLVSLKRFVILLKLHFVTRLGVAR